MKLPPLSLFIGLGVSKSEGTMLSWYKEWVKRHPNVVQNLDWLLLLTVWNPSRTNGGFEFTYEVYHAAVGLLSLWHQSILEEGELPTSRPAPYLWLDAIEYLETLIELRGMHLERCGKMSRYAPLVAVESAKAVFKMLAWSRYSGHMFLRRPTPDDLHQFESELGLQDILASLERLRRKYIFTATTSSSTCWQQQRQPTGCVEPAASFGASACCSMGEAAACGHTSSAAVTRAGCCFGGGAAGCRAYSESYGLRQYMGEQVGRWAWALVPFRRAGAVAAAEAGGCGGICSAKQAEEGTERCCIRRASLRNGYSTPPRYDAGAGGGGDNASARGMAEGSSPVKCLQQQQLQLWRGMQWQWVQQLPSQGDGPEACTMAAGKAEDPDAHMGRNLLWLSELLHIWRPVVYVTLLKRYGRRSWRPWATSLAVDLLSGHFHRRGRQHLVAATERTAAAGGVAYERNGGDAKSATAASPAVAAQCGAGTSLLSLALARSLAAPGISAGEERELYDRRRKLALYALRSPFLEATTLSWLALLRDATRRVPLLGFGADYLYGIVDTLTAYYCYTSGSN